MAFAQEGSWNSASIAGNVASTATAPVTFVGGGAELLICPLIIDNSNLCTGATISGPHLTPGPTYVGLSANGVLMALVWGTYNGPAGSPTLTISYTGGNSGTNGGKIAAGLFTGYTPGIIASPGASGTGSGNSASAALSPASIPCLPGDLVIAWANNNAAHNFMVGAGYSLIFNTSAWAGNISGYEQTTGLSEPSGNASPSFSLTSSAWNMMAVDFPGATQPLPPYTALQWFDQSTTVQT